MLTFSKVSQIMVLGSVLILTGCASSGNNNMEQPAFSPTYSPLQTVGNNHGSIYQAGTERTLFEDMKAKRIGDILTVMLVEQTSGQNSSGNNVNQSTDMNVTAPTFGGSTRNNMGIALNSSNSFNGESGSSQSNSLNGSVAVTVTSVLPNGNLIIEGEKWIKINQGNEYIRLQGVIRQKDIDTYNTVYSTQIADARISYSGKGTNARGNTPGWAAKLLFSSLWPF